MDEKKTLKKAYKKAKRKTVTLWKTLTIIVMVLAIILSAASVGLGMFDNTIVAMMGGSFWELENEDANAQYYTMDLVPLQKRPLTVWNCASR